MQNLLKTKLRPSPPALTQVRAPDTARVKPGTPFLGYSPLSARQVISEAQGQTSRSGRSIRVFLGMSSWLSWEKFAADFLSS